MLSVSLSFLSIRCLLTSFLLTGRVLVISYPSQNWGRLSIGFLSP